MIVFKHIRFKNFKSYGNAWAEIDLNKNQLTAILGQNGGGKSTMLDAINFALYGKSFNSAQKSKIVNSINGKNCRVELTFETNGSEYKVIRGIKPNVFEIYQNGNIITQSSNVKDYQSILENQILKMTMKNFTQTVLVGTASFIPFMELSANDRRIIIENILGIGILTTMNGLIKNKIPQNTLAIQDINHELQNIKIKLNSEKALIDTLKKNHDTNLEKIQGKIEQNEKEIARHEERLKKLEEVVNKLNPLNEAYGKFKDQEKELLSEQSSINTTIKTLKKDINFITKHDVCPFCKQDITESHKHTIQEGTQGKVDEATKQLDEILKRLDDMRAKEQKFTDALEKLAIANRKVSESNTAISMLNRENLSLSKEVKTNTALDDVKQHEETIKDLVKVAKEKLETKNDLLNKRSIMEQAQLLLKDSGIKTAVVNQYLPTINKLVNKYLADMDFYLSFELDSQFNESIKARDRDDFTYQNLSQGERRRLDLAILFVWRHISQLRNSCATNLLVVDEVLDSSLDEEGCESALSLFRSMKDSNIFLISHRDSIQDSRFDKILRVKKERQFSTISD